MKSVGQLLLGLVSAVGVSLLVLSAFSLALIEGGTPVAGPAPLTEVSPTAPPPATQAAQGVGTPEATGTHAVTATATQPPACSPPPAGWTSYIVQIGDTLESIAAQAGASVEQIRDVNCIPGNLVAPGIEIYLPYVAPTNTPPVLLPTAPPTATVGVCLPPAGWIVYIIRQGDTLYSLGRAFGVSAFQLQVNNCLPSSTIYAGQRLYVPNVPTITPPPTQTERPTDTPEPTNTTEVVPTEPTATNTAEPTETNTPEPTPTDTETPEPPTVTPTSTLEPSFTPTITHTPTT